MSKDKIYYSQCWEDSDVLDEALCVTSSDVVLSVTSGGDNTLSLLLKSPKKIVSIDYNNAQNYLLEIKLVAAKSLKYSEYIEFLGVENSDNRRELFDRISTGLSLVCRDWWLKNVDLLEAGLINCGRFERFTILFSRFVLPFIHSKKTLLKLVNSQNLNEQIHNYNKHWDTYAWRFIFRLFSSKFALKHYARHPEMFNVQKDSSTAKIYLRRLKTHLISKNIKDNHFMHFSMFGNYGKILPTYLKLEAYDFYRSKDVSGLSIITENLFDYLKTVPDNTFSKFNLSDIFESVSSFDYELMWDEIYRVSKSGAVVVYWNNLVRRNVPEHLLSVVYIDEDLTNILRNKDGVFFYDGVCVCRIKK